MNSIFFHAHKRGTLDRLLFLLPAFFLLFAFWVGVHIPAAHAAGVGVKIKPATIEDKVEPGDTYSFTLEITNTSDVTQTYYLLTKNIKTTNDAGAPVFAEEGEPTGMELSEWMQLPTEPITIDAGGVKTIPVTIQVPTNATPAGHFAAVFASMQPNRPETSGTGIGFQAGAIINLQIGGDVFENAIIREFSTDKSLYGKTDVTFSVTVENDGNVLVRPRGVIEVIDMFGAKVPMDLKQKKLIVNDLADGVFPKTTRTFTINWKDKGFRIGRYEAVVNLAYGVDVSRNISQTRTFWILPMNVLGPVLGGLLVIILIIYFSVRAHIRRKVGAVHHGAGSRHVVAHRGPTSRLTLVAIVLLVFTLLFLLVLFFAFA